MSFNLSENFCNFVNKEIAFICLIKLEWLTVCSYHATYAFQSESTLYSCLNVKELLARNRLDIWRLSDCNGTWTHNHLVRKRTLNHLVKMAKSLSCVAYLYGTFDCIECGFTLKRVHTVNHFIFAQRKCQ